jgi:hypothetical protein
MVNTNNKKDQEVKGHLPSSDDEKHKFHFRSVVFSAFRFKQKLFFLVVDAFYFLAHLGEKKSKMKKVEKTRELLNY